MTGCSVIGCKCRSEKGFMMVSFPTETKRRAIWIANIGRKNWEPKRCNRLCEQHFDANQWEKIREDGKCKLKRNAIPTIFQHDVTQPEPSPCGNAQQQLSTPAKIVSFIVAQPQTACIKLVIGSDPQKGISQSREHGTDFHNGNATDMFRKTPQEVQVSNVDKENDDKYDHMYAMPAQSALTNQKPENKIPEITQKSNDNEYGINTECISELTDNEQLVTGEICENNLYFITSGLGENISKEIRIPNEDRRNDKKYADLTKIIEKQHRQLIYLRKRLKTIRNKYYRVELKSKKMEMCENMGLGLRNISKIFNNDQLALLNGNTRTTWSTETMNVALGIKHRCGRKGYAHLLSLNLPYPSLRTLRRYVQTV